jgi:hypothetical protein
MMSGGSAKHGIAGREGDFSGGAKLLGNHIIKITVVGHLSTEVFR